jgi:hypothetical protein
VISRRYKVSATLFATALLAGSLLASRSSGIPVSPTATGARAEAAHLVDLGRCRATTRELRFEWLKPGEEPALPEAGQASVCLAVYPVPADPR